jgi:hypothetical protein
MRLDAVVGDDIRVIKDLQDPHLVADLGNDGRDELWILQANLLYCHQVTRIQIHGRVHGSKCATTDELSLLPSQSDICSGRR